MRTITLPAITASPVLADLRARGAIRDHLPAPHDRFARPSPAEDGRDIALRRETTGDLDREPLAVTRCGIHDFNRGTVRVRAPEAEDPR